MNSKYVWKTIVELLKKIQIGSFLIFVLALLFSFNACSSSTEEIKNSKSFEKRKGEKTFSFYEDKDGKEIYWEVNFNGDLISSAYKNGDKISSDEIEKNEAMIFDKINELRGKNIELGFLRKHHPMDLKIKEQMKDFQEELNWKFNDSIFRINMEKLKEGLAKIEIPKFHMEDFHFKMDSLNECLKDLEFNHEFEFNMDEFNKNMESFADGMKEFNFNFDLPDFDFHNFDPRMDYLDDEMENLNMEMKKLENFLKELKSELVKDKILQNKDEKYKLDFETEKIIVNGKELPDELFQKYKRMYKEYFGKDLSGDFYIVE